MLIAKLGELLQFSSPFTISIMQLSDSYCRAFKSQDFALRTSYIPLAAEPVLRPLCKINNSDMPLSKIFVLDLSEFYWTCTIL